MFRLELLEFFLAEHRVSDETRNAAAGIIRRCLKAHSCRFQDSMNIPAEVKNNPVLEDTPHALLARNNLGTSIKR